MLGEFVDSSVRKIKTSKLPAEFSPPAACDVTRNVTRKEGKKARQYKG